MKLAARPLGDAVNTASLRNLGMLLDCGVCPCH